MMFIIYSYNIYVIPAATWLCVFVCMCVNMFPVVADAAGWLFIYGGVLNEWKILWGDHNWLQKQKLSRISYFYETRKKTPSSSLNH